MKNLILLAFTTVILNASLFARQHLSENTIQKVDSLLSEYPISNGPGISVAVIKDGKAIFKRHKGYANLEHRILITDSTKFVIGSIAKQFTAFAILLLENEGLLSIDNSITNYLPELNHLPHKVTIKQLMNHTSGFRDNTNLNNLKGRTDEDLISQEEVVALLLRQKSLNFTPGSRFQYCNSGYILLAEIVKRVSGISFSQFTQEKIFKPLKMHQSVFLDDPTLMVTNKADSYIKQKDGFHYIPLNRSVVGSTGLYTTIHDLGLWANNFENQTIGNKTIFQKMKTKSSLNTGEIIPYALGQELKNHKGLDVIFHGGGDAGFRSYLLRVPSHKLTVAISGNFESFNPLNISYGLVDIFLSKNIQKKKKKEVPVYKTKDLKKFEGDYKIFNGFYITIEAKSDTLYFKNYGSEEKLKLPTIGENEFLFPYIHHSKFRFTKDGLVWHLSDFYYPGKKVFLNPPKYEEINISEYTGVYRSAEVETSYTLITEDNQIKMTHNYNPDLLLEPISKDVFRTNQAYMGK
ncbi:class A beta-lactamase-related serine hydrolase [Aquimarina sp. AD10]|uniref:serine hydrolase domain-containing protein n=1 Tax=Aquimarina sp. AD10 TaxID=1714849 RepID=UPI000E4D6592|nr:serine hydrolase domain-containing protein [Aquimarina sp. AD10]AXT59161.1 class A beta-lactamase-related serine hydrolase [Aquimarina sp. AD10]